MTRRRALAALGVLVAVLAATIARAPAARAQDSVAPPPGMEAPVAPPAPAPAPGAESPAPPAGKDAEKAKEKDPKRSMQALEDLIESKPAAAAALVLFRFGLFAAGIVLILLAASRRSAVRKGLLPAPPPVPAPVVALPLPYALLLVLGVYLLVDLTGRALLEAYPDTFRSQTVLGIVAMALPSIAASFLVLRLRANARQEQVRPPPPVGPSIRRGAWTYVVGSAAAVVAALVAKPILEWAGQESVPQVPVLDAVMGPMSTVWLITAYGILVAPFAEEALFRGLLHPAARVYLGARGATIGVAVLFALVHQNLFSFLPLFTLALFLGWLMEETDSLLATFTVHALFNATNLIPILLFRYA